MREAKENRRPLGNIIDRAIEYIAPGMGLRRRHARTVLALTGGYEGGRHDKRGLRGYNPLGGSADTDINTDLITLRNRTRDLARNNSIGGGAIHRTVNHVVGIGLRMNARIDREFLGMDDDEAKAFERQAERGFATWARECDLEHVLAFEEIQELAFRSVLESGDVIVILPNKRKNWDIWGTKIQLIEADRLCNKNYGADNAQLVGGIELDEDGAPVAYNVMTCHPGDIKTGLRREWDRYPAYTEDGRKAVLHLFRKLRPGQHRGVPYLAPVIEDLKQLGRYSEAELMAAVVSGMFTGFITGNSREGFDPTDLLKADGKKDDGNGDLKLGYGTIVGLADGEEINFANPGRPNQAFDGFVLAFCRYVGMALEQPYEVLVGHFTSSYSAARAALQEAWVFYNGRRAWLIRQFCQPCYEAWMWEAVSRGYLWAPGFFSDPMVRQAYLRADWIGSAPAQLDPLKEVVAAEKRIGLHLTHRQQETATLTGDDWESKVPQMKYEEKLLAEISESPAVSSGNDYPVENPDQDDIDNANR